MPRSYRIPYCPFPDSLRELDARRGSSKAQAPAVPKAGVRISNVERHPFSGVRASIVEVLIQASSARRGVQRLSGAKGIRPELIETSERALLRLIHSIRYDVRSLIDALERSAPKSAICVETSNERAAVAAHGLMTWAQEHLTHLRTVLETIAREAPDTPLSALLCAASENIGRAWARAVDVLPAEPTSSA
jgi:hypothetical protein